MSGKMTDEEFQAWLGKWAPPDVRARIEALRADRNEANERCMRVEDRAQKAEAERDAAEEKLRRTELSLNGRLGIQRQLYLSEKIRAEGLKLALSDANHSLAIVTADYSNEKARAEKAEAEVAWIKELARVMFKNTGVVEGDRPDVPVGKPAVYVDFDRALTLWAALTPVKPKGGDDGP
jgi:chromosome segregation ATPase